MEKNTTLIGNSVYLPNPSVTERRNLSVSSAMTYQTQQHSSHRPEEMTTLPYQSSVFDATHYNNTQNVYPLMGSTAQDNTYTHNHSSIISSAPQLDSTILFPFVCGVCSLQFNKVLDFFSHFKVHNFHNFSEEYFHTCSPVSEDSVKPYSVGNVSLYTCGLCALPLPSLCLLHEHLVCVERAASYTVNIKTRVTENIVLSCTYNQTAYHYSDGESGQLGTNTNTAKQGYDLDVLGNDHHRIATENMTNNNTESESGYSENNNCPVEIVHQASSDNSVTTYISKPVVCGQIEQHTQSVLLRHLIDMSPQQMSNDLDCTNVKQLSEKDSNTEKIVHDDGCDKGIISSDVVKECFEYDTLSENQEITCEANGKEMENEANRQSHSEFCNTSYHRRTSERLKASSDSMNTNNTFKQTNTDMVTRNGDCVNSFENELEDDYVDIDRERKFDDPKREKRRLLMIKYQRNYRDRKRLKAQGLWPPRKEGIVPKDLAVKADRTASIDKGTPIVSSLDDKVPCDVCGLMFKKKNLKRHVDTHSTVKAYQCDICLKTFKTRGYLYGHKVHHKTVKDLICDHCGKAFNNGPNLRQHLKTHVREKTLQCPMCPKKFRSNYVLKDHIQRHSDAKPYSCRVCGRMFKVAQEVTRHMLVHSEERPHVCATCNKGFKCRSNLIKHEKIHLK